MTTNSPLARRWLYLAVGVFAMLFSGVLYAWSILKIPFSSVFGWSDSALAYNFTLTMCFFCVGAFAGSLFAKRFGTRLTLILAGVLTGGGFILTGFLTADLLYLLYVTYAFLGGCGIGITYNVIVSTVAAWFPDRKGFSSGCLMMGFGFSTLLLGSGISKMFDMPALGWSKTYILLGSVLIVVLIAAAFLLRRPDADTVLPTPKPARKVGKEDFAPKDYMPMEMLKSFTYYRAFVYLIFTTAVGNSVISFARDLVLSVDAAPALATTLVGVLAVCNGVGRILTGVVFDTAGRRFTMITGSILTIAAAGITLTAVLIHSLPLCIAGLCITGLSYGTCPTVTSAFTSSFYGQKYFSVNYSITNFNLVFAACITAVSNTLYINTGSFAAPFIMLLILAVAALGLNISIRRP